MNEKILYRNFYQIVRSIEVCLSEELITPSLILIYAGIDIAGWLNMEVKKKPRESFTKWVDYYMLSQKQLPCNSLDLYAARCGLLHRFGSATNLSQI